MWNGWHLIHVVLFFTTPPWEWLSSFVVITKFSPTAWCSVAWVNMILVYWLCYRLIILWSCTHKICGMSGNPSMACVFSCNNIHQPDDGLVVLQFSPNLVPQIVCARVGWIEHLCIDCDSGLSDLAHAPTKYMECLATHPWHVVLCITTYTNWGWKGCFAVLVKSGSISYECFVGLDG